MTWKLTGQGKKEREKSESECEHDGYYYYRIEKDYSLTEEIYFYKYFVAGFIIVNINKVSYGNGWHSLILSQSCLTFK